MILSLMLNKIFYKDKDSYLFLQELVKIFVERKIEARKLEARDLLFQSMFNENKMGER